MPVHHVLRWSIEAAWIVFCAYWFIMAFNVKDTAKRQSLSSRGLYVAVAALAYLLLFTDRFAWGPLAWRFVPDSRAWELASVVVTWAGVALAIWARTILGSNWSGTVTVKQNHTLVRSGPYATVRHPIYSGLLLAGIGTALAIGEVHSVLAVAIGLVSLRLKSKLEERFMIERFGQEYEEYRQHSWALVPFVL